MTTESERAYPVVHFDPEDDPEVHQDHWRYFDDLREHGPAFFSPAGDGIWILTDRERVSTALSDTDRFSSAVVSGLKKNRVAPAAKLIPVQLDRPEHTTYRKLLNPSFTPEAVRDLKDSVRARCRELVESLAGSRAGGEIEFMDDFARVFPTVIFLDLVGLPVDRATELVQWSHAISHVTAAEDPTGEIREAGRANVQQLIADCLSEHRENPRDDVIGRLLESEIDGRPLTDAELHNMITLLYIAGLDTVAGTLGYIWQYLATHPDQRARIVAGDTVIPTAVEEFLRYFSTVSLTRTVREDMEFGGCPMKSGDKVWAPIACANRDPQVYEDALEVRLDRSPNRHIAFGIGPHRCVGSHLARMEVGIALEEWHRVMPDYSLAPDVDLTEKVAGMACFQELRLSLGAMR